MGGKCPHRSMKKCRYSNKSLEGPNFFSWAMMPIMESFKIQKAEGEKKSLPIDEDLPGMGQFYCMHCNRYFASLAVRDEHFKTKRHRKLMKLMTGPAPHTQLDTDLATGMGMPDNGPKLMSI